MLSFVLLDGMRLIRQTDTDCASMLVRGNNAN